MIIATLYEDLNRAVIKLTKTIHCILFELILKKVDKLYRLLECGQNV